MENNSSLIGKSGLMGRKTLATMALLIFSFAMFILYEKSRLWAYPFLGFISLAIFTRKYVREIPLVKKYKFVIEALAVSTFFFWIFMMSKFNEQLLSSSLADWMTTLTYNLCVYIFRLTTLGDSAGDRILTLRNGLTFGIDARCSGVHSTFIFIGTFIFMMFLYRRRVKTSKLSISLLIGVLGSYLANILRITMIGLAGVLLGLNALLIVHKYLGYIILLLWIGLFWHIALKVIEREEKSAGMKDEDKRTDQLGG